VGYANNCELGTLAKGASKTVTAGFTVITFPSSQTHANVSNGATVVSRNVAPAIATDDPNSDNDSNSTSATADLSSNGGGCSTGGGYGLLAAALALVALRFARRRTA
jgi:uncharacterized protein (TIGR03382 family)